MRIKTLQQSHEKSPRAETNTNLKSLGFKTYDRRNIQRAKSVQKLVLILPKKC